MVKGEWMRRTRVASFKRKEINWIDSEPVEVCLALTLALDELKVGSFVGQAVGVRSRSQFTRTNSIFNHNEV